jgi:hypothetical protein
MLFVNTLLPIVYVLFLFCYRRRKAAQRSGPWDRLMLLNIVGLCLFAGVVRAPAYSRLCSVSIPALILLVWLAGLLSRTPRAVLAVACAFTIAFLWIVEPMAQQLRRYVYLDTPSGRLAYAEPIVCEKHRLLLSRTHPGDYFFEAAWGISYFLLGLRDPARVPFVTTSDYTRPEEVSEVIESLEGHRVQFVLWHADLDMTAGNPSSGDHLGPLRRYLREHYRVVKTFDDLEQLWQREQTPDSDAPRETSHQRAPASR